MDRYVNLCRMQRGDQGTRGILFFEDFNCRTLELPWRDNNRNISCVPPGEYKCKIRISPKYAKVYWITEVDNRTYILIHSGNWAGDVSQGYRTHTNGCLLLGQKKGIFMGQWAVLNSRITIRRFMDKIGLEPFTLRILENFPG